jgi:multidrug efflux system outer membrane protein
VFALLFMLAQPVVPVTAPADSALSAPLPDPTPPSPPDGPVLSLAQSLAEARAQNPDLAVAYERVVQAQNNIQRAWAAVQPTLNAVAGYTYNSYPNISFLTSAAPPFFQTQTTGNSSKSLGLNLAWSLFNLRVLPQLATAKQQVTVAQLNQDAQRRTLLLATASTYYSGLTLRELAQVSLQLTAATREHARVAQARFEAGLIQRSAALRARIDYLNADQEVRRAQYSYAESKSQLAALLDRHDTSFELAEPQEPPQELRGQFTELLEAALRDRPEMAAARANEEIAARLKTDAWAMFAPTFTVNADARHNDPSIATNGDKDTWSVSLALSLPLYDGGFRYVALKDADSQIRQAKAQTRSQGVSIEDELRRAMLDLSSARALRDEAEQALSASRENEKLVRAQFDAGIAAQVEVSDAESALFQSESNALQQRLSVQLAALRIAKAVGAFDAPGGGK